jgi:hypothetical protein
MQQSFVIWTFQRTGGTALTSALSISTKNSEIKHEPFNRDRDFSNISKAFREGDISCSTKLTHNLLESGLSFKHCFELHSIEFNSMLLEVFDSYPNYRHIILMRNSEIRRILSLYLAKQTNVWGKWKVDKGGFDEIIAGKQLLDPFPIDEMINHSKKCLKYRDWIQGVFKTKEILNLFITYEDLYERSPQRRIENFKKVFDFVGATFTLEDRGVYNCIFSSKQGSDDIFKYVPNIEEAKKYLSETTEIQR